MDSNKVLILRSCRANGSSRNGFVYPLAVGAVVEAPDWNGLPECGGGLHGLLWGRGDDRLMCWDDDAQWQVFECDAADVVEIGKDKCKFRRGVQVYVWQHLAPGYAGAMSYLAKRLAASGDSSRLAASGDSSRLAASGNSSQLASSGDYSQLASSGYNSRLAASGDSSIAVCSGLSSRAMVGDNGCLALAWHDGKRPRVCVGYAGEDGIKAGVWYEVRDGKLTEVAS